MHAMSNLVYLEVWCDIQTFELAAMQKIFMLNNFGSGGGLDWTTHDTLSVPHACNVRSSVSWVLLRHSDIRTCRDAKNFPSEQFRIQRRIQLDDIRHAVASESALPWHRQIVGQTTWTHLLTSSSRKQNQSKQIFCIMASSNSSLKIQYDMRAMSDLVCDTQVLASNAYHLIEWLIRLFNQSIICA